MYLIHMKKNYKYKDLWNVYYNGQYIGYIWFVVNPREESEKREGHCFMHADLALYDTEINAYESYWGCTIGWEPEVLPDRRGRRNGESKAKMRYRVLELMIAEYRRMWVEE